MATAKRFVTRLFGPAGQNRFFSYPISSAILFKYRASVNGRLLVAARQVVIWP
jgi:hypothetical protein